MILNEIVGHCARIDWQHPTLFQKGTTVFQNGALGGTGGFRPKLQFFH
jgi:hypothetical protein